MNSLQLMKDNPKATVVVKQWVLNKLLDSLKDSSVPDDFKEFVKLQDIDDDKVATIIDAGPRMLFDVFDENNVYIQINVGPNFSYSINQGDVISGSWENRVGAEKEAIEQAFKLLEEKL